MGGIVVTRSLRVAGDELDEDIINYVRNKYNLFIGQRMAEKAKIEIGSAYPMKEELTMDIRGRNLVTGLPEAIEISSVEIREAISSSIDVIVKTIRDALDEAPPEIHADLLDNGICLAGGTSQIKNLTERLSNDLKVRAWVAEDPMTCVARGCGIILENKDEYSSFLVGLEREPTGRTLS
jgi:rod shape-determining protein MreB